MLHIQTHHGACWNPWSFEVKSIFPAIGVAHWSPQNWEPTKLGTQNKPVTKLSWILNLLWCGPWSCKVSDIALRSGDANLYRKLIYGDINPCQKGGSRFERLLPLQALHSFKKNEHEREANLSLIQVLWRRPYKRWWLQPPNPFLTRLRHEVLALCSAPKPSLYRLEIQRISVHFVCRRWERPKGVSSIESPRVKYR